MLGPLDTLQIHTLLVHLPEWTHFPESLNVFHYLVNCVVDFFLGCETTQSKADAGVGQVLLCSDGTQNVGGLQRG